MIVKYPSNKLNNHNFSASTLSQSEISDLCEDMREAAWQVNGLGIAAPQIGKNFRIFGIIHPEKKKYSWFLDPEIVSMEGSSLYHEGCLSIPDYFWPVIRHEKIYVTWFDENFNKHGKTFTGIHSRIFQHEMDHIDGLLIPDFLNDSDFIEFYEHFYSDENISTYEAPQIDLT